MPSLAMLSDPIILHMERRECQEPQIWPVPSLTCYSAALCLALALPPAIAINATIILILLEILWKTNK
jgi:hypothetical protein